MGPDLLWFFQDWILANAQGKVSETLTPAKWQRALQSVDHIFFYTVKVCLEHTFLYSHSFLNCRRGKATGCNTPCQSTLVPDLLEDVMSALDVKLGPDEYEPLVSDRHPITRSVTKRVEESASQPQRLTPKYLRIIATPNDHQKDRLKAEWEGDVGVLRSECVKKYFPDVVWTTPESVA